MLSKLNSYSLAEINFLYSNAKSLQIKIIYGIKSDFKIKILNYWAFLKDEYFIKKHKSFVPKPNLTKNSFIQLAEKYATNKSHFLIRIDQYQNINILSLRMILL